jgi:hypothetical protein
LDDSCDPPLKDRQTLKRYGLKEGLSAQRSDLWRRVIAIATPHAPCNFFALGFRLRSEAGVAGHAGPKNAEKNRLPLATDASPGSGNLGFCILADFNAPTPENRRQRRRGGVRARSFFTPRACALANCSCREAFGRAKKCSFRQSAQLAIFSDALLDFGCCGQCGRKCFGKATRMLQKSAYIETYLGTRSRFCQEQFDKLFKIIDNKVSNHLSLV